MMVPSPPEARFLQEAIQITYEITYEERRGEKTMTEAQLIEMVYSLKTGELLKVKHHGTIQVAKDPYEAYAQKLLPKLEEFLRKRGDAPCQTDAPAAASS